MRRASGWACRPTLLPFQPYERLSEVFGSADVLVVLLEKSAGAFSVPSKTLSYLCAGRPVIGLMPAENLASQLLRDAGCAVFAPESESVDEAAKWVVEVVNDSSVQTSAERVHPPAGRARVLPREVRRPVRAHPRPHPARHPPLRRTPFPRPPLASPTRATSTPSSQRRTAAMPRGIDYDKGSPHLRHDKLRGMVEQRLQRLVRDSIERTGACRVVEIGAGHGTFTRCLLDAGAQITVTEASSASARAPAC